MHKLHELKNKLIEELKEYGEKDLSAGSLDVIDKLTHTIKNLCKVIEDCEESGYSERYYADGSYRDGSYRDGAYRDGSYRGGSYARGRGMSAKRDSMGRYASHDDMHTKLNELMADAPDERTRVEFQKFISKLESM